jgi:hypothetical protein
VETPGLRRFFAFYTLPEARALLEGAGLTVLDAAQVHDSRNPNTPGWASMLARKP